MRLAWELLGISFDRDDERRVAAKGLVDRKPHDAAWTAAAVELLRQPRRTTKAVVGMVVSA